MSKKRMFCDDVTHDDSFIDMSVQAQLLYYHIGMDTDDEGFCDKVSTCMFRAKATKKHLKELIDNKYLIDFGKVVLVKHHFLNNTKRSDRIKETKWKDYRNQVELDDDGIYHIRETDGSQTDDDETTKCQPSVNQKSTKSQQMVSLNQINTNQYKSNQINDDYIFNKLINGLSDYETSLLETECQSRGVDLYKFVEYVAKRKPDADIGNAYKYLSRIIREDPNWNVGGSDVYM